MRTPLSAAGPGGGPGFSQRDRIIHALRNIFLDAAVEEFVLEEKDGVIVADC